MNQLDSVVKTELRIEKLINADKVGGDEIVLKQITLLGIGNETKKRVRASVVRLV